MHTKKQKSKCLFPSQHHISLQRDVHNNYTTIICQWHVQKCNVMEDDNLLGNKILSVRFDTVFTRYEARGTYHYMA